MKKKYYGLLALTLLGVALSSCGKSKNVTNKDTTTDVSTDTSTTSTNDDLSTTTKTKTTTTTTTEDIIVPTTSIDIPDMEESTLEQIYTDFKKIKLPTTYTKASNKTAFLNAITIDNESDDLLSYDCIEQTGYEKEDDNKTNYLIDNSTVVSADDSYSGSIFGAYVYNVNNWKEYNRRSRFRFC